MNIDNSARIGASCRAPNANLKASSSSLVSLILVREPNEYPKPARPMMSKVARVSQGTTSTVTPSLDEASAEITSLSYSQHVSPTSMIVFVVKEHRPHSPCLKTRWSAPGAAQARTLGS
jgi:hypothetical protein